MVPSGNWPKQTARKSHRAGHRGRRHQDVDQSAAAAGLGFEVFQHLLLVEEGLNFEAGRCAWDGRTAAAVAFQRGVQHFTVAFGAVTLEGALFPGAVKGDLELSQQGGCAD